MLFTSLNTKDVGSDNPEYTDVRGYDAYSPEPSFLFEAEPGESYYFAVHACEISSYPYTYHGDFTSYTHEILQEPYFWVFPHEQGIYGWHWSPDSQIYITINGNTETFETNEHGHFFLYNLTSIPGDIVTVEGGTTTREHTVNWLDITEVDRVQDIARGDANANSTVIVRLIELRDGMVHLIDEMEVTAQEDDQWEADFGAADQSIGDYTVVARQEDGEGNATAARSYYAPMVNFYVIDDPNALYPGPIAGAEFQLYEDAELTIEVGEVLVTNEDGMDQRRIPGGNYWFKVTAAGFNDYTGSFTVGDRVEHVFIGMEEI